MIDNKYRGPAKQPRSAHIIRCAQCNKRAIVMFESCLGYVINKEISDDISDWINPGKKDIWFCPECAKE